MGDKPEPTVIIVSTEMSSGKPLDFSFKEIDKIEQLLFTEQRQGVRLPIRSPEEVTEEKKEVSNITAASGLMPKEEVAKVEVEENEDETHRKKRQEEVLKGPPQAAIIKLLADSVTSVNAARASGHGDQGQSIVRKKMVMKHTRCLILSYNLLEDVTGLMEVLPKVMKSPLNLGWIDLSFNLLRSVAPELCNLSNLKSLYLHCNYILALSEVAKLKSSPSLQAVTLHGNPIERLPGYRLHCIAVLPPTVKKLDSALITTLEHDNTDYRARPQRKPEKRDDGYRDEPEHRTHVRRLPKVTDENLLKQFEEEIQAKKDKIRKV